MNNPLKDLLQQAVIEKMPPQSVPSEIAILSQVLSKEQSPHWAATLLTTSVTNFVGNISDETWQKIVNIEIPPCDTPGCKCHEYQMNLIKALEIARDYFTSVIDKRTGEKGFSE